jgi:hypothetical protein
MQHRACICMAGYLQHSCAEQRRGPKQPQQLRAHTLGSAPGLSPSKLLLRHADLSLC